MHHLIVVDTRTLSLYATSILSFKCRFKKVTVVNLDTSDTCKKIRNLFFRKHCIALNLMSDLMPDRWLAVHDGDVAVVNPAHSMSEFKSPGVDVVHCERFHNGEIAAGSYLIKNSADGRRYLTSWISLYRHLPRGFHNHDNGALHVHLSDRRCFRNWFGLRGIPSYDRFVHLCKRHIYDRATRSNDARYVTWGGNVSVKIIDRANAWVVDSWSVQGQVSPRSFMHHAMKKHPLRFNGSCRSLYDFPMISDAHMKEIVLRQDLKFARKRFSVGESHIRQCGHMCG